MGVQGVLRETEGHGQKFGDRFISRIHEQTGQVGGFRQTPHSGESVEKFPCLVPFSHSRSGTARFADVCTSVPFCGKQHHSAHVS